MNSWLTSIGTRLLMVLGMIVSILAIWQLIILGFAPPEWLFPGPLTVWEKALELWQLEALQPHIKVTAIEVFSGYLIGVSLAFSCAYPISQLPALEKWLMPYLIAANSMPLVAFAPLLLLWFGSGIGTKIIVTALIVFFPMITATIAAFHQQHPMALRLMRALRASKWQRFRFVELPSAVPGILAGLKITAPLAVVGAVVGEFLGAEQGLGHLIMEANGLLDTAQLFIALILLALLGTLSYSLILGLEAILIGPWHLRRRRKS
jgi:NitT/TauT family transport system permease protein